jgi:hypothetical protein
VGRGPGAHDGGWAKFCVFRVGVIPATYGVLIPRGSLRSTADLTSPDWRQIGAYVRCNTLQHSRTASRQTGQGTLPPARRLLQRSHGGGGPPVRGAVPAAVTGAGCEAGPDPKP